MRLVALLAVTYLMFAEATFAQESTPTPSPETTLICRIGQQCKVEEVDSRQRGPVNDPPGNYVRSLITMGLIAFVVGTYLFFALSNRRFPIPLRRSSRT